MNRAATFVVLVAAGMGTAAFAQDPPASQVPPPPQTQGQINSLAAKYPTQPERMKPLAAAAQASPGEPTHRGKPAQKPKRAVAESKPKTTPDEHQPKAR